MNDKPSVMKTVIIEDEKAAVRNLTSLLNEVKPEAEIIAILDSINSTIEWFDIHPMPELVFMDIHLADGSAFEIFDHISITCPIIFTTAYDEYALRAFKVNSIDYLLKPFNYSEFLRAATKALRTHPAPESIFVKSDYKLVQVQLKDILYIEGLKDYIRIQTEDGQGILTLMSMKSIEDFLPADTFVRVHRSYIINMNKIKTIERNRIIFGKVYIPISDSYKDRFTELLDKRAIN